MSSVQRRRGGELATPFGRLDRLFDEWMRSLPMRRPFGLGGDVPGEDLIRVDEFRDGNTQVDRAELPGIDPDKDVELTVDRRDAADQRRSAAWRRRPRTRATPGTSCATAASPAPCRSPRAPRDRHHGHLQRRHPRDPHAGLRTRPAEPTKIAVTKG